MQPPGQTVGRYVEYQQPNLAGEDTDLVERFNRSGDGTMVVPSDYLEVVVTRR